LMEILSWGFLGIFVSSWLLYLIPFIGPSTMIFSGAIAAIMPHYHPVSVGIAVAAGASLSKAVHYYVTYFASRVLSAESVGRLQGYGQKIGRWKSFATFISSATFIPDEPVLISLALVRYNPLSFLLFFFVGKLVITIPGAYMGRSVHLPLSKLIGSVPAAAASVIFTVIVTVILLKVDLNKLWRTWTRRDRCPKSPIK